MVSLNFIRKWIGFKKPESLEHFHSDRTLKEFDLGVVTCYFNSNHYQSRKANFEKFYESYQASFSRVPLQVVELAFGDDAFELSHIPGILQLRTKDILWQKERLLTLGINRLIEAGYKNIAWVDSDVLFTDLNWPEKALDVLDTNVLCQLFSQSIREEEMHLELSARNGVARDFLETGKIQLLGLSCGYGWAAKGELLKKCTLYDSAIMGGGDAAIWLGSLCYGDSRRWLKQVSKVSFFQSLGPLLRKHYLEWAKHFGEQVQGRVGYVEQKIIALYHGKISNRLYSTRYLHIPELNPADDLLVNEVGCWSWREEASPRIKEKVRLYFYMRQEDEPMMKTASQIEKMTSQTVPQKVAEKIEKKPIKLCIQIPCYHEELTLLDTLKGIPTEIEGVSSIEVVVIDDGSTDQTVAVARFAGVRHIVKSKTHRGLANAFKLGIQKCLSLDADIIVNLDGDNQYPGKDIIALIRPILQGRADIVLGARRFTDIPEFSEIKILFQHLGSSVLSKICHVKIPDAATGFRAFSRNAAAKINVFTKYTYTLETLIQAAQNGEKIISVPIKTNRPLRPSRLFSHPTIYVLRSFAAIIRLVLLYNPLRIMSFFAVLLLIMGFALVKEKFNEAGYLFFIFSSISFIAGLILDQISVNRKLLESIQQRPWDRDPEGIR